MVDRAGGEPALPVYQFVDTSRAMLISEQGLEPFSGSGQIILFGRMGLTAAHTLPRYRGLQATSEMILPGMGPVRFEVLEAGPEPGESVVIPTELAAVESVGGSADPRVDDFLREMQIVDEESAKAMKHIRSFEAIADDWVLVQFEGRAAEDRQSFGIETGPIPAGTCVSVFRSSPDGRELWRLDLLVVGIEFEGPDSPPVPEGIVGLRNPRRVETDGWSGGFVGLQDEDGTWKLIGVLTTSDDETGLLTSTRPPRVVLERLIREGAEGGLVR